MSVRGIRDGHVMERLSADLIIWLGTVRPDGRPHMVPVWFDWDGETITIFSKPDNQKVRNLRHDPRVIIAVDDTQGGSDVVLLEGEATLPEQAAKEVVTPAYGQKYREGMKHLGLSADQMVAEYSQVIRVRPTRFMGW